MHDLASKYHSQFGEDRILDRIFGFRSTGLCVEVGANNGVDDSTSYFFEQQGWDCILVEPNPVLVAELKQVRRGRIFECAVSDSPGSAELNIVEGADRSHGMSSLNDSSEFHSTVQELGFSTRSVQVDVSTLDRILEQANIAEAIDFISVDVEGLELQVLRGLSLDRWRPRIILTEDNSWFTDNAVADHLARFGYRRIRRTGVNDWFAHESDAGLVNTSSQVRMAITIPALRSFQWLKTTAPYRLLVSAYHRLKS